MQIVIDIDDDMYKSVANNDAYVLGDADWILLENAIANGTPLPKHHGRLIDADEAIKVLKSLGNRDYRREKGTIQDAEKMLSYDGYTPTIIEGSDSE